MVAVVTNASSNIAQVSSALAKARGDADSIYNASEEILFQAHAGGREDFSGEESAILIAAGYEARDVNNLYLRRVILGRVAGVVEVKAQAGTNADYERAKAAFEKAKADIAQHVSDPLFIQKVADAKRDHLAGASPSPLVKQLVALADKLIGYVTAREEAEATVRGYEAAREKLRTRDLLPHFIYDRWLTAVNRGCEGLRVAVINAENELSRIVAMIGADLGSVVDSERVMNYARTFQNDLGLIVTRAGSNLLVADDGKWKAHVAELNERRKVLEPQVVELKAKYAQALADADKLLNYYVDQLG